MRRPLELLLAACLVTACGGSARTPVPLQAPAPERPAHAEPDPYHADDPRSAELARAAGAVLDAFYNWQPRFTRDGRRVVFVSDRDGLPQLYLADAGRPDAAATRLLTTGERMADPLLTPDGRSVIFLSDEGADEHWAIFRVDLDGGNLVELTPATLQRDTPILVDARPDTLFYSGRTMSDVATTVYRASATAAGEETSLYRDEKPGFLLDVSPDGRSGLFLRYPSGEENHLVVLDLATGRPRPLYPARGKVTIASAAFSADGQRVFVGTDGGGEQALLLALDAATGRELARYVEKEPATATIAELDVDEKGDLVAVGIDAGNRSELRLLDARTLERRAAPALPLGSGSPGEFSPDGERLGLVWETPSWPSDLFAIDTRTGAVSPLRREPRPGLDALPALEVSSVELEAFDGGRIPANLLLPAGVEDERLPVLVEYHGGPAGSSPLRWSAEARFFVGLGYAWVEPNVRGSTGFGRAFEAADNGRKRLDAFRDVESAGRWAASQPWADGDRLVVHGGSYGGYTVLIALSRMPDLWRAGVDLVGVANLQTFMATTTGFIREIFLVEFGDPDRDVAFLASISPLDDVDQIVDPLFVYTGANDSRVPRAESDQIVEALRARGVPVEYMVKDDEGHSLDRRENQIEFYVRVARFLEKHLE